MKLSFLLAMALGATTIANASIVVNGGFETGDFTGWTLAGSCSGVGTTNPVCTPLDTDPGPHSGVDAAYLGSGSGGALSQILTTVAGDFYDLNFWVAITTIGGAATPNAFSVIWDGNTLFSATNLPAAPYAQFSFTGLIASGASTTLQFLADNSPADFVLDDVVVTPVPEPSTFLLCATVALSMLLIVVRLRE